MHAHARGVKLALVVDDLSDARFLRNRGNRLLMSYPPPKDYSSALLQKKDKPENYACDLIDYVL